MRQYVFIVLLVVFVFTDNLAFSQCVGYLANTKPLALQKEQKLVNRKISIVFHVLYNDSTECLADSFLTNQVHFLNGIYTLQSAENIRSNTKFSITSPRIDFTIENQNGLNQITRSRTDKNTFNIGESLFIIDHPKYSSLGGTDAWNADKYLNIWVCNLDPTPQNRKTLLGYAFPPTLSHDWDFTSFVSPERQGVVINYRCFLDSQYFNILAHEIGHYLGLKHIWGNSDYSCDNDDGIEDTPLSATPSYTCDYSKNICNTGADDLPDMVENIMDYSPASCGKYFTYGQVQRMISNLVYLRPDLYTSEPGNDSVTIMEAFPNPSFGKFTVFLHTTRTIAKSTLEIIDLSGKIIYSEEFNGKKQLIEIPPEHFRHGLYILRLHNEKYCLTKKIQFVDR